MIINTLRVAYPLRLRHTDAKRVLESWQGQNEPTAVKFSSLYQRLKDFTGFM